MNIANTYVRARIDTHTKDLATAALAAMGLSVSDAIRLLMVKIAKEQQLPFIVNVPNAQTQTAMEESRTIMRARRTRFDTAQELFNALEKETGQQ